MKSSQIAYLPISVVMSVYNGERYIEEAIKSVLNQSFAEFEFIIVDDGSKDRSFEIISKHLDKRIVLLRQENKGLASALNKGIELARGKYIARMDADDIALPQRLELQYNFLESHPKCVVVGTNANIIDRNGNYLYTSKMSTEWELIKKRLPLNPFYHSSTMFRKEHFNMCSGYNEKIKHHFEDMILWNQMARIGELRNLSEALINYRLIPSSISNKDKRTQIIIKTMYKKTLRNENIIEADLNELENAVSNRSSRWRESNYYLRVGKALIEYNFNRFSAAKSLFMAIAWYPLCGLAWFNLILLLFPKRIIDKWKESRRVD